MTLGFNRQSIQGRYNVKLARQLDPLSLYNESPNRVPSYRNYEILWTRCLLKLFGDKWRMAHYKLTRHWFDIYLTCRRGI